MNAFYAAPELDIAFNIGQSVEQVQAVFLDFNEKDRRFTVLTVVPERDDSVCRRVYAVEREIIDRYDGLISPSQCWQAMAGRRGLWYKTRACI